MGRRSDFARRPMDAYATPYEAVPPLLPFLAPGTRYCEPCGGDGSLIRHLAQHGMICIGASDIDPRDPNVTLADALCLCAEVFAGADAIITNPPWTRYLLHPLISHLMRIAPTWLLFDASWPHTRQAAAYLRYCSHIVSVGRVKWIPDSPYSGKDDAAWYRFDERHVDGPHFYGRDEAVA